jgi:hypothetical protein
MVSFEVLTMCAIQHSAVWLVGMIAMVRGLAV